MKAFHLLRNLACSVETPSTLALGCCRVKVNPNILLIAYQLAFGFSPPGGPVEYFVQHLCLSLHLKDVHSASERIHFSALLQIKHVSFTESVLPHPATAVRRARMQARRQAMLPLIPPLATPHPPARLSSSSFQLALRTL